MKRVQSESNFFNNFTKWVAGALGCIRLVFFLFLPFGLSVEDYRQIVVNILHRY